MSFLLLSVDHIIAIHDEVLELHELQGMAGDKSLEGALSRVDNRLKYGLMDDIYSLAASKHGLQNTDLVQKKSRK